ncbi:MAG: hypothetical protein AABZ06_01155 [Bdellovibrionota bacterium]
MKFQPYFGFVLFCLSLNVHAATSMSAIDAVKSIKQEFLGYNNFSGSDNNGNKCKITIVDLEINFSGIQVRITDNLNKIVAAVSIDSNLLSVAKTVRKLSNQTINLYEIYDSEIKDSSLIAISHHEDVLDFDLVLMPSVLKNKHVTCSYIE